MKETFLYSNLTEVTENKQAYVMCLSLFGKCRKISSLDEDDGKIAKIIPDVSDEKIRELLALCNRDENERMVSIPEDEETEKRYQLRGAAIENVYNLHKEEEIHAYRLLHPYPTKMEEVFQKIEELYPEFVFTKRAYKTAATRVSAYKKTGYDTILQTFRHMHELLFPFYTGNIRGKSELQIFDELRDTYGIDISPETDATMKQYGKQREVTIEGTTYLFTNHIKFSKDACRIHFKYIDGKIYIGHAGKHLDTVSG